MKALFRRTRARLFWFLAGVVPLCSRCGGGSDAPGPSPIPIAPVPTSVAVQLATSSVTEGDSTRATASVTDQNGRAMTGVSIVWTTSAPLVASITEAGSIVALAPGQATIGAEAGNARGSATLTVLTRRVSRVRITPVLDSIKVGNTLQLSVLAEDARGVAIVGRPATWSTSDTSLAAVSATGLVAAKWAGAVNVTVDVEGVRASTTIRLLPVPAVPFAIRGIKLFLPNNPGMYNEYLGGTFDRTRFESWHDVLQQIRRTGANHIWFQFSLGVMVNPTDTMYSQTISFTPPLSALQQLAQEARSLGLAVTVGSWSNILNVVTGTGGLDRPQPTDRAAWLRNYGARLIDRARFAQSIGASAFVLFQDDNYHLLWDPALTQAWVQLIRDIRAVFSGSLTSVLWTNGAGRSITDIPAAIISELDYLGLGLFPNLVRAEGPDVATLCRAYRRDANGNDVIAFLKGLATRYGKRIWITDKAFHSFKGAAYDEWRVFNPAIALVPDEVEQQRLFESFLSVMSLEGRGWLEGTSFQNFNNIIVGGGQPVSRFTDGPLSESPQHKLAEATIRDWFNGTRASSCPIP